VKCIQIDGVAINAEYITMVSAVREQITLRRSDQFGDLRINGWLFEIAVHDASHGNPPMSPRRVFRESKEEALKLRDTIVQYMAGAAKVIEL